MIETPGQSNQDRYPVQWISLAEIGYRFEAPEATKRSGGHLEMYRRWEDRLVAGLPNDAPEYRPEKYIRVKRVFDNFVAETWVFYPLVLGFSRDFRLYAVRGNVRLCCLRAYNRLLRLPEVKWLGRDHAGDPLIPCYIKHPDDSWGDNTRVRDVHPWKEWS